MITYASLKQAMLARLDAEGTQRYLDAQDLIPAVNAAVNRAVAAINYALANRKSSEELLSELTYTRVFQTNIQGGLHLSSSQLGHEVWTLLAVYADAQVLPNQNPAVLPIGYAQSRYRSDLTFTGGEPCRRITIEQIAMTKNNKYMQGNEVLANTPWVSYAYCILGDRGTRQLPVGPQVPWQAGGWEVVVYPVSRTANKLVGVSYLKQPDLVSTPADSIEFPQAAFNVIVDWALQYLSTKQGDGTTLYGVSDKDALQLFGMQS